jgi:VIT1/CCC1 family predicted Fe2+/Mn2+ transporter
MIFVIWTQFTEVESCVIREADSLNDLLRFGSFLHDDARSAIRRAASNYVRQVLGREWDELGEGRKEGQTEEAFAKLVAVVVGVSPKDENEQFLREHLFEILRTLSRHRDERIARSLTRMPPTLSGLVKLIAGILLLLIFLYPFHSTLAGAACLFIASLVLFLANFVMTDTDNPLKGVWNVRPDAFSELPR